MRVMHFHSSQISNTCRKLHIEELSSSILNRKWMLEVPDSKINQIVLSPSRERSEDKALSGFRFANNVNPCFGDSNTPSFYVVRDDLLHPLVNGKKARKLDALFPLLLEHSVTDVVTCGGCQSAHTASVAVSCAERGIKSHLLLRGEQPQILTGYNLVSTMYGDVTYVPRSVYANRETMLRHHADLVAGENGVVLSCGDILESSFVHQTSGASNAWQMDVYKRSENCPRKILLINEGAGDTVALLGLIRLVEYLSQKQIFGKERRLKLVVDAGTGTTAVGLALGALCLGLPWDVTAIMLADTIDVYRQKEKSLVSHFKTQFCLPLLDHCSIDVGGTGLVHWVDRWHCRKFGNVLEGEVKTCQQIANQTGIPMDPVYTLAAWEMAIQMSEEETKTGVQVVMLHTGGTLGMFGLAQRHTLPCPVQEGNPPYFLQNHESNHEPSWALRAKGSSNVIKTEIIKQQLSSY